MSASWPFSTVDDFNFNTGPGIAVPTSPAALTAFDCHLVGGHFTNTHATNFVTVLVINGAGKTLCRLKIPPGGEQPYEWPFRPAGAGVTWSADLVGLLGHLWGYVPV